MNVLAVRISNRKARTQQPTILETKKSCSVAEKWLRPTSVLSTAAAVDYFRKNGIRLFYIHPRICLKSWHLLSQMIFLSRKLLSSLYLNVMLSPNQLFEFCWFSLKHSVEEKVQSIHSPSQHIHVLFSTFSQESQRGSAWDSEMRSGAIKQFSSPCDLPLSALLSSSPKAN